MTLQTGPMTEEGKSAASRNAIKHGIFSDAAVIYGEDEREWIRHRDSILEAIAPEDGLEAALAGRIALLLWRVRRVERFEIAVVNNRIDKAEEHVDSWRSSYETEARPFDLFPDERERVIARVQERRIVPPYDDLDKIMRYESHLHRQCVQALHEVEALQARRRGESTPLARLDVEVSGSPPP